MASQSNGWTWWKMLLWAYSTIYNILLFIIFLIVAFGPKPTNHTSAASTHTAAVAIAILYIPVIIFLIITGIERF